MTDDKRYPLQVAPWFRGPCAVCSTEYLISRGEPRMLENASDETCEICIAYQKGKDDGLAEGYDAGRAEALSIDGDGEYQTGFRDGRDEGYEKGHEEGRAAAIQEFIDFGYSLQNKP